LNWSPKKKKNYQLHAKLFRRKKNRLQEKNVLTENKNMIVLIAAAKGFASITAKGDIAFIASAKGFASITAEGGDALIVVGVEFASIAAKEHNALIAVAMIFASIGE
jgi:hypothetical protein